jgi:hypothetical protein
VCSGRGEAGLVYEIAHRAFRFLLNRYGEERVRRLLLRMGEGREFADAFQQAIGIPTREFESEFRRHEAA